MKTGSKVLLFYLMLSYGPQSVMAVLFTSLFFVDYKGYSDGLAWKFGLMFFIGAAIFFGQSALRSRRQKQTQQLRRPGTGTAVRGARIISALTYIALSVPFGLEFGFSFFHSGQYLSDLPMWVIILQAMKPLARLDLAYCTLKVMRGQKLGNVDLLTTFAYTIGGVISLVGAIDIVYLVLGCLLLIKRGQLVMRAFTMSVNLKQSKRRWFVYLLLVASLPGVAIIGFANKIGFERTYDLVSDAGLLRDNFAIPLILRVSSSHGSFMANADLPLSISDQVESVTYPIDNMLWRGCILFSAKGCPNRADITHLARLNYIRTFWDQSPLKAGATPGLLASALYIPFLPFSILLLSFYCSLFTGSIDRALRGRKVSIVGVLTLVLFSTPVFENPVDIVVMFDPAVVYTLGFLIILLSFRTDPSTSAEAQPRQRTKHGMTQGGTPIRIAQPVRRPVRVRT